MTAFARSPTSKGLLDGSSGLYEIGTPLGKYLW